VCIGQRKQPSKRIHYKTPQDIVRNEEKREGGRREEKPDPVP